MKIAITAQGRELSSEIDPRFGRAKWLIVVNTDTGEFEAHDNSVNLNAVQGAGIQTAQNIANLGVEAVITSNVGPNAFRHLIQQVSGYFLLRNRQSRKQLIHLRRTS